MKVRCRKWLCPTTEQEVEVDDVSVAADEYVHRFFEPTGEGALSFVEVLTDPPALYRVETLSSEFPWMYFSTRLTEEEARAEVEELALMGNEINLKPGIEA